MFFIFATNFNETTGHLLGESYPSAEMQSVYSTAATDGVKW